MKADHIIAVLGGCALSLLWEGCSEDMQQQPSYQPQEAPRVHAPSSSVPRESRAILGGPDDIAVISALDRRRLFAINCAHCHGRQGFGDGPVAGYLKQLPVNLRASRVQTKSIADVYAIISDGKDMMPSFRGEMTATERWAVAEYVRTLKNAPQHEVSDR